MPDDRLAEIKAEYNEPNAQQSWDYTWWLIEEVERLRAAIIAHQPCAWPEWLAEFDAWRR